MVHRLRDLCDHSQPFDRQMQTSLHQQQDELELLELIVLRRSQWIRFEERHDLLSQFVRVEDRVHEQVFTMVVSATVPIDTTAPEMIPDQLQNAGASFTLNHRESRLHLPTQPHGPILMDWTAEAAFTVDKADDPLLDSWPFLLIARTRQIVTTHVRTLAASNDIQDRVVPRDTRVSQLIANCTLRCRQREGQAEVGIPRGTLGPF